MFMYRLKIWSERGRIERSVKHDRADALECIHAAGVLATGLHSGRTPAETARLSHATAGKTAAATTGSRTFNDRTVSLLRDANSHLKEAWLLLSSAGAREAASHVRKGLRLARRHPGR
jgi:hypothetical protein